MWFFAKLAVIDKQAESVFLGRWCQDVNSNPAKPELDRKQDKLLANSDAVLHRDPGS